MPESLHHLIAQYRILFFLCKLHQTVVVNDCSLNDLTHLGECNSGNSDRPRHQSLSDIPGRRCSQMHERDLCRPAEWNER